MKRVCFMLFWVIMSIGYTDAQSQDTLTNASVLEMLEFGFEEDVIISKIQSEQSAFDTSLDALKELKSKGVPSAVLAAMVKANSKEVVQEEKTGIYYLALDSTEKPILPTVFSGTKTRTLASAFTYGIASGKMKSILNGANSQNVLAENLPSFLFYFRPFRDNQHLATDWWFRATTSPNEFVLVVLKSNKLKNTREIETGKVNLWVGTDAGVGNDKVIPFTIENCGDGVFKITPSQPLDPGEYCFFYKGTIPQGGYTNQSVFDFSIQ